MMRALCNILGVFSPRPISCKESFYEYKKCKKNTLSCYCFYIYPSLISPFVSHSYYGYTKNLYGADIAAAFYVLSLKGGFR